MQVQIHIQLDDKDPMLANVLSSLAGPQDLSQSQMGWLENIDKRIEHLYSLFNEILAEGDPPTVNEKDVGPAPDRAKWHD